jgi:hypothetical protein
MGWLAGGQRSAVSSQLMMERRQHLFDLCDSPFQFFMITRLDQVQIFGEYR